MSQGIFVKQRNLFHNIAAIKPPTAPVTVSAAVPAPVMTADCVAAIAEPITAVDIHPADYAAANAPPATGPTAVTPITAPTPVNVSAPIAAPPTTRAAAVSRPIFLIILKIIDFKKSLLKSLGYPIKSEICFQLKN